MHIRISAATIAFMGLCVAAPTILGQAPQAQNPVPQGPKNSAASIAIVDVGYLLKQHPTMNANMEAIKSEMTQAQEEIETRRKSLLSESEMVGKTFDQNHPDYKQKQETLISAESKLRVDFMSKEKEFAEKQAGVIYSSYQSINSAIALVANHYKYDLVLRYSKEQNEMDPKKPQTVNFGIQRDILYFNPQIDITELVLGVLKRDVPATAPVASQASRTTAPVQQPVRNAAQPNGVGNRK